MPLTARRRQRREVDVVEQAVIALVPEALVQQRAHHAGAMGGRLERVGQVVGFRPMNCDSAMAGTPCSAASIAPPMVPE
jgi:hypothetical protein